MSKRARSLTREERKIRNAYYLCVVAWAALIAGIVLWRVPNYNGVTVQQPAPEPAVVEVDEEVEAAPAEYDPVRDDIPLDPELQRLLYQACTETGVRYEMALAVIWQETDFRNIVGDDGDSVGYMQVQEQWHAERMARLGIFDLTDPYGNFLVGCDFLAELFEKHEPEDALTKYNSGRTGDSQYARDVLNYMNILTMEEI